MTRLPNINKKRKEKIKTITIYSSDKATDEIEIVAHQIYRKNNSALNRSNHKPLDRRLPFRVDASVIVKMGKIISPELFVKESKNVGLLIRCYKRIEELVDEFGIDWYDKITTAVIREHDVLSKNLEYYIKRNTGDTFTIKFVNCNELSGNELNNELNNKKISSNIRMNNPVIRYE